MQQVGGLKGVPDRDVEEAAAWWAMNRAKMPSPAELRSRARGDRPGGTPLEGGPASLDDPVITGCNRFMVPTLCPRRLVRPGQAWLPADAEDSEIREVFLDGIADPEPPRAENLRQFGLMDDPAGTEAARAEIARQVEALRGRADDGFPR